MSPAARANAEAAALEVEERSDGDTRTLWAITADIRELADYLRGAGGEITDDEAGKAIEEWLSSVTLEHYAKLNAIVRLMGMFDSRAASRSAEADVAQAEADRLKAAAARDEKESERLRTKLLTHLRDLGVSKTFETDLYRLTITTAGGKQAVKLCEGKKADELPDHTRTDVYVITADGDARGATTNALAELAQLFEGEASTGGPSFAWKLECKVNDPALRNELDRAIAARSAREERKRALMANLDMSEEEADQAEPRSELERILDLAFYAERKVSLKIT